MAKPNKLAASRFILGLLMLTFVAVACNNKAEKETKTDTTKMDNRVDTTTKMKDTTVVGDTTLQGKPVDEGD